VLGGLAVNEMAGLMYLVPGVIYALLVLVWVGIVWRQAEPQHRVISVLLVFLIIALPASFFPGPPTENGHDHTTTTLFAGLTLFLLAEEVNPLLAAFPLILACIADPFALWIGTLPIVLVGIHRFALGDRNRALRLLSVATLSLLATGFLIALIPRAGGYTSADLKMSFAKLDDFSLNVYLAVASILTFFGADFFGAEVASLNTASLLLHLLVMLFVLYVIYCVVRKWWLGQRPGLLVELLVVSIAIDVIAFLLSTAPQDNYVSIMGSAEWSTRLDWSATQYLDWSAARYLPAVFLFVALMAAISWPEIGPNRRYIKYVLPFVAVGYLTAFGAQLFSPPARVPQVVIDFLEERNLKEGYGSYWSSGIFTVLSDGKVRVRQVRAGPSGQLEPLRWVSAKRWYETDGARFLIFRDKTAGVDLDSGVATWGEPASVETIDGYHIAIWTNPIHVANTERVWK
jgi:hypothetical protein